MMEGFNGQKKGTGAERSRQYIFPPHSYPGNGRDIATATPHKIFLWDEQGVYVDCAFPNPVHGHFLGGTQVGGARLTDLFPRTTSQHIIKVLNRAFLRQEKQKVIIDLERQGMFYQADIQLFPMGHHVMGWVTDHLARHGHIPHSVESGPQLLSENESLVMMLTAQEKNIIKAFGPGETNRQIADTLGLSERTVRFHMSNLLHKLHLPSRVRLAHLRLFEADILHW